jgi:hypothetical protein
MKVEHDPRDTPAPRRHLCCAHCGHGFTVSEGTQALERKRRLEAGLPADPDGTHKAFRDSAEAVAKVWPL